MALTKRDFLKNLGLGAVFLGTNGLRADEYIPTKNKLPEGSVGDPDNVWFGQRIFPLPHTIEDGPSCRIENGKIIRPAAEIPLFHKTDVVVVGGGPAGFSAALASARAGAKTTLVESTGSLGGLFTNGMVLIMLCTSLREESGRYRLVTHGICEEFMTRAEKELGANAVTPRGVSGRLHWQPTIDPEGAKYLMDRMIEENQIDLFFHASGVDVIQNASGVVQGIVFQSKQGPQAILAKQVVDCTGDGDLFFAAGSDFRQITHGIGSVVRYGNLDRVTATALPRIQDRDRDPEGLDSWWPMRGNEANPSTGWRGRLGPKGDGLSVRDLTCAELNHRKFAWEHVRKLQKTPGWEQVYLLNTASMIGPRATRLLTSEQVYTRQAIAEQIGVHETIGWFGDDGVHPGFPVGYRALVPTKADNILAAGRCLGAPDTVDTFRLICPCFVTGQAAGVAAALSAQKGCSPRQLNYVLLKKELEKQNVYLG